MWETFEVFFQEINNILPTIKFTVEHETNNSLPFLDVLVIHHQCTHTFSFKVYRKPTNSENYIHFYSYHSHNTKSNVVTSMFLRALRICDPQYLEQEFNHIHRSFLRLGYPSYFVKQCLSKANRKYYQANNVNTHSTDNFITIPFSLQLITAQQLLSNVQSLI